MMSRRDNWVDLDMVTIFSQPKPWNRVFHDLLRVTGWVDLSTRLLGIGQDEKQTFILQYITLRLNQCASRHLTVAICLRSNWQKMFFLFDRKHRHIKNYRSSNRRNKETCWKGQSGMPHQSCPSVGSTHGLGWFVLGHGSEKFPKINRC